MADSRISTSTQIRNFYSDGMSYMNIKFYNTNLSFQLYPFLSKDQSGKSSYDLKNGQMTTVNFEGAFALYQATKNIIEGKIQECNLPIPCAAGASLNLERKLSQNGTMETIFSISKNGVSIPYRFPTIAMQVKENGQIVTKTIESGLGAFNKTIEGYLTGINSDRHLDKLTDDYIKAQEGNNNNQQQNSNNNYNSYRNNSNGNGYKKPYNSNNNGGYKKPYNNNGNYNNNSGWNNGPRQQNMSDYQIKN